MALARLYAWGSRGHVRLMAQRKTILIVDDEVDGLGVDVDHDAVEAAIYKNEKITK